MPKKQVFCSAAMVAGMGCNTFAFRTASFHLLKSQKRF
jgi:hypothetical protein